MNRKIAIVGNCSSLAAFFAAVGYGIVQVLQVAGILVYPLDAQLIYGFSLAIAPLFLLAILALHYSVHESRRFFSHAALLFALLYTVYVVLMYGVQLATVIPASLKGARETLLTVTPHSLFWTVDALGYICMGISTLLAYFALPGSGHTLWLRRFLLANGLAVPLICFAYFYPQFSVWVLLAGAPWLITATGSLLQLALYFKSKRD
ncbi:hypothetical protein [Mucilaginibacter sp. L3T2-6]|uniref:hypothetical protein n=1 Tax=Mucilaginibacter sp. L3T2-6 TaxID=3062491 RepID=UPI00267642FD|nr:hypothetical protein [Mucilaginibacter sp. L3T2-6]MDO3643649.1 hypothetical protein [Mucilaginibacter sp. L3T2-6]MDV6216103.1 hypothetical protein [Mucilaginibacter sp. L3T2-6]